MTNLSKRHDKGHTAWLQEVKLDGYRCLAGKGKRQVTLWSCRQNLFIKQFPRIAQVCEQLKPVCQTARAQAKPVGLDQGRNEQLLVAQTELVAQIEFTEWTPDGHLRH